MNITVDTILQSHKSTIAEPSTDARRTKKPLWQAHTAHISRSLKRVLSDIPFVTFFVRIQKGRGLFTHDEVTRFGTIL